MHVQIRLAEHDGRGLGPGRALGYDVRAQFLGQPCDELGRPGAADQHPGTPPDGRAGRHRVVGAQDGAACGQRDGSRPQLAFLPQGHVHGPVLARRFGELAGAVERIDDPDSARTQTTVVVGGLLRQGRVVRPVPLEQVGQDGLGTTVPGGLQLARVGVRGRRGSDLQEPRARFLGAGAREGVVVVVRLTRVVCGSGTHVFSPCWSSPAPVPQSPAVRELFEGRCGCVRGGDRR